MRFARRSFLKSTLATATALLLPACGSDEVDDREVADGSEFFPQSVASGDPKPTSVVLWTRVQDEAEEDLPLELEVYADEALSTAVEIDGQRRLPVTAEARFGGCVKVRVEGLEPGTLYWYRFVYAKDGVFYGSALGRTKTAPADDFDGPIRFAFVSCQDFGGRYYNAHAHLARQELDFVVHLGDYIYETAGDASFQDESDARSITFDDSDGALTLGEGEASFQAARSIDNYRQLYRTYRSDSALQRVHERFPMIVTWDDHEFSDDCHGATGTYLDGRADELDLERRQNANQAWFEYMPVDYVEPEFEYDRARQPPDDIRIHRDLVFGRHLHLVMTDLRSRRSDHLVPENAYPGTILVDEATLASRGEIPPWASPYVPDVAATEYAPYLELLRSTAEAEGYPTDAITGPISVDWIARVIEATGSELAPIDPAGLPLGCAVHHMNKGSLYSSFGSRYFVPLEQYELYADIAYAESSGATEDAMGAEQEEWFLATMRDSNRTWKVWGNEFCLMPLNIDLRSLPVPDSYKNVFNLNVDDWNGMPNRRDRLLAELSELDNVVAITGDIHAFFAGLARTRDGSGHIVEFVGGSVSSTALAPLLQGQVEADPTLSEVPGSSAFAGSIRDILLLTTGPNDHIAVAETRDHGHVVVELDGTRFDATFYMYPTEAVAEAWYDEEAIDDRFRTMKFRVEAGAKDLLSEIGGTWRRWDPQTRKWI